MEEVNEDSINKLLGSLPDDLTAIERMIMVNEGTVQTFLSVLCGQPVKVEVISQKEFAGNIIRWSKLIIEEGDISATICLAESIIPISNIEQFNTLIDERKLGIGQIIKSLKLDTSRRIMGFHSDSRTIARTYAIEGNCDIIITESFNRDVISKISSTRINRRVAADNVRVLGPMNLNELSELLGVDLSGGVQPKKDTTGNTKVGEVVASEQPTVVIKEGDSE